MLWRAEIVAVDHVPTVIRLVYVYPSRLRGGKRSAGEPWVNGPVADCQAFFPPSAIVESGRGTPDPVRSMVGRDYCTLGRHHDRRTHHGRCPALPRRAGRGFARRADCPALLERAAHRLHVLCANLLYRSYPRLTKPPLNLETEEMLSGVVEGLLKAMRSIRPQTVRQFFALANQHMRWQLNDLARRLDEQPAAVELQEGIVPAPASSGSGISADGRRMLDAIDKLPDEEREVFGLVRLQGLTKAEAAKVLDVSAKTVQRRLNRARLLLAEELDDLRPKEEPPANA